jgi:hypothetical protein
VLGNLIHRDRHLLDRRRHTGRGGRLGFRQTGRFARGDIEFARRLLQDAGIVPDGVGHLEQAVAHARELNDQRADFVMAGGGQTLAQIALGDGLRRAGGGANRQHDGADQQPGENQETESADQNHAAGSPQHPVVAIHRSHVLRFCRV